MLGVLRSCVVICWFAIVSASLPLSGAVAQSVPSVALTNSATADLESPASFDRLSPRERGRLVEQIGNEGARRYAQGQAWEIVFDGLDRGLPQGIDQVYADRDGVVYAVEAKGGSSSLSRAYGYMQGSTEWAVEAAHRVLRSPGATDAEKHAAELVLRGAAEGRLSVAVIRTPHSEGRALSTSLESIQECSQDAMERAHRLLAVAKEAGQTRMDHVKDPVAGVLTHSAANRATVKVHRAGRFFGGVAAVVDAGLRVRDAGEIEQNFRGGRLTLEARQIEHARNVGGMLGGWGGAVAGAKLGAAGGGTAGTVVAPGPGTATGVIVGGLVGGAAGYTGGEASAEYVSEWAVEKVHAAGTSISGKASGAWRAVSSWTQSSTSQAK